ncbi:MAG: hypothetical protein J0M29_07495 [Chitinophagales bacterium]|nr:hypothetical protein [Chitinophagales bacterium]
MRVNRLWIIALLALGVMSLEAREPVGRRALKTVKKAQYRDVCANSESQIDQAINNVRARLLGGGDCWWDLNRGRYIVPKVDPASGQPEVSSIFAGAVWLGGVDPGNNLKLACQDYRSDGRNDFWPGPISLAGVTESFTCANWDRHFRVTGEEIRKHLANIAAGNLNENDIPRGVKGWPAKGNEYFRLVWGFDLPFTEQALAGFYDKGPTYGTYEPLEGDYPSIEIRGCQLDRYPDEMIFWIYNDQGGGQAHARTNGRPIQMEVQVQAFGYTTNDELNDMTFQRYKLINRATDRIDSTFFAMWVDADLGCDEDDYIGCDTAKSLMYIYNQDQVDGNPGATCPSGAATYGNKIPMLGVDYFRGPLGVRSVPDTNTVDPNDFIDEEYELGMNSFMYYNRGGLGAPSGTVDPSAPQEYYNYITGTWRDGTPLTYGGSGFNPGDPTAARIRYAFTEPPNDVAGWSMCTANLPFGDRRTLQASGPFTLKPGAVNELIIGIPWVPEIEYPCPDMEGLFRADKLAQGLFDNCFELLDGPDAPTVDWIEMNEEVVAVLTNKRFPESNNFVNENEDYEQIDFLAPDEIKNSPDPAVRETAKYKFEGYLVYQLKDENVSAKDFSNPERGRLVYQVDTKNGIKKLYNWEETRDPSTNKLVYYPVLAVEGADQGIRHTFSIKEDKFAAGNDKSLINHKKYFFAVVAYAHNNFAPLDPFAQPVTGQQRPYLAGRRNIVIKTVIPRPVVDQRLNTSYGDGVVITRLEGQGAGGNFLDLDQATRDRILANGFDSTLTYQPGRGPLTVTIFNPFEVQDGQYEVALVDGNMTDNKLDANARWQLRKLPDGQVIASEKTIEKLNEQVVLQYGFSLSIAQTGDPGQKLDDRNGGIGAEVEYADPNQSWLFGFPDDFTGNPFFNFVKTGALEEDETVDPKQGLSTLGNGWFVPYVLADFDRESTEPPYITPAWFNALNNAAVGNKTDKLLQLPNVDIVLTSDKSKWSRCVVVETATSLFTADTTVVNTQNNGNKGRLNFDTRYALSVGKTDANNDGLPDPDGELNPTTAPANQGIPAAQQGQPVYGMSWFPGYAIDVETGRRLNIFFGENSGYRSSLDPNLTGRDMMWNPTDQFVSEDLPGIWGGAVLGGHHWIYVMNTNYDSCTALRKRLTPEFGAAALKVQQVGRIAWAGMLQLATGYKMKSYNEGLIPTDTRIKLRVDNSYQTWFDDNNSNLRTGHPRYQFTIEGSEPTALTEIEVENALDSIKMVPNPYYGFSEYETSQFTNTVKITNLPGKCKVTIYSLDGKFIRQYNRDETYMPYQQITPAIEWDLKNSKGIPVASGVYLVHVNAPGLGERTLKWFGIGRQYDPSGL